jgi:hypothetical protein
MAYSGAPLTGSRIFFAYEVPPDREVPPLPYKWDLLAICLGSLIGSNLVLIYPLGRGKNPTKLRDLRSATSVVFLRSLSE